jgi:hypothetical protein
MKTSLGKKGVVSSLFVTVLLHLQPFSAAGDPATTTYDWGDWKVLNATTLSYLSRCASNYGCLQLTLTCSDPGRVVRVLSPPKFENQFPKDQAVHGGVAFSPIAAGQTFKVEIDLRAYTSCDDTIFGLSNVASTNKDLLTALTYRVEAWNRKGEQMDLSEWTFFGRDVNSQTLTENSEFEEDLALQGGMVVFRQIEVAKDSLGHFWKIGTNTAKISFRADPTSPGGDGMWFFIGSPCTNLWINTCNAPVNFKKVGLYETDIYLQWTNFDFRPQFTPSLSPLDWKNDTNIPSFKDGAFEIAVPATESMKFFRLTRDVWPP